PFPTRRSSDLRGEISIPKQGIAGQSPVSEAKHTDFRPASGWSKHVFQCAGFAERHPEAADIQTFPAGTVSGGPSRKPIDEDTFCAQSIFLRISSFRR